MKKLLLFPILAALSAFAGPETNEGLILGPTPVNLPPLSETVWIYGNQAPKPLLMITGGTPAPHFPGYTRENMVLETAFEPHVEKTERGWKITFPK